MSVATAEQSVLDSIRDSNHAFSAALARGDAAALAALYAADARLMPPGAEEIEGRDAIQAAWQQFIDMGAKHGTLTTVSVEQQGDLAVEIGCYELTIEPAGAPAMQDEGKYVVVRHRDAGGSWSWTADIWNSNLPAVAPQA